MKKVLHVSHSLDTGGGPLYIKKITDDVPQIDHYVAGNSGHYFSLFRRTLGDDKTHLLSGKNLWSNVLTIRHLCKKNAISIVHCHGRGAALYGRLAKLLLPQIRIVYTVHGFHPGTLSGFVRRIYVWSERFFYHFTDAVINVSLSERDRFRSQIKPKNPSKIYYIPNYITADDVTPAPLPIKLHPDYINFLYVGRLSHEKGIYILLDAMDAIANDRVRLFIIGYGPMEDRIPKNSPRVTYLGKVESAGSLLHHFSALIIPSRFEGMPYIGLECMISRTCAIVTPAVGITDLFTAESSYMANDFSRQSLADVIKNFVNDYNHDRNKIKNKIERSYERVQSEFSRKNSSKIYEIYESL